MHMYIYIYIGYMARSRTRLNRALHYVSCHLMSLCLFNGSSYLQQETNSKSLVFRAATEVPTQWCTLGCKLGQL